MKYLLVLAISIFVIWLWKSGRRPEARPPRAARPPAAPQVATEVVECALCHVHLPRGDALPGPGGVYCSEAHRRQAAS
jgi:uncharacterized protein